MELSGMSGVHPTDASDAGSALRETSGASTDPSVYSESEHICVLHDGVDDLSRRCSQLVRDAVAADFSWIGILRHEAFNRFQADLEDRLPDSWRNNRERRGTARARILADQCLLDSGEAAQPK